MALDSLAGVIGVVAAGSWLRAAAVPFPPQLIGWKMGLDRMVIDTYEFNSAIRESSRLNKVPAGLTTLAVLLGVVSALVSDMALG